MNRRPVLSILAAALFLVACGAPPEAEVDFTADFVPFVADSADNVGLGNSIAVTEDGTPYISYFGFPADLEEGEIPTVRPVGSAFIPAVQVATVNLEDGIWSRGAVAQASEFSGVVVPFGPETLPSLERFTPESANGTAIALDGAGGRHVAWVSNTGVWYASSGDSSSIEQVSDYDVSQAGPVGRPGIAVDGNTPWIAWTATGRTSLEVHAATPGDQGWIDAVVAELELCNGCPPPAPTGIGVTPDGPVVVYVDHAAGAVMSARLEGDAWTTIAVDARSAGLGLSTTTDPDGAMYVSYYGGDGSVVLATGDGASWSTTDVAEVDLGDAAVDPPPMTGVAVDSEGTISVTWDDPTGDTVRMARGGADGFEEVEVPASSGGRSPSVATSPDGSRVFVAWYDARTQDLVMGLLGGIEGLRVKVGVPSPATVAEISAETCEPDGRDLSIVALGTAFDATCLAVVAGEAFTITMDNQDPFAHNFSIYTDDSFSTPLDDHATPLDTTVVSQTIEYEFPPIEEADTYFFQCDFHPVASMRGTFIVE